MKLSRRDVMEAVATAALTGMNAIDMRQALGRLVRMGWFDETVTEGDVGRTRAELMAAWVGEVLCAIDRHDWHDVTMTVDGRTFIVEQCARCSARPKA